MYTSFEENSLDKTITLLKSHKAEFVSGEQLSKSLNMSRAAIWKNIKRLQSLGYNIQSKPNLGYKLISKSNLLLPWEILDGLQTNVIGQKIYYFDTIDSTQNFALKLSEKPHENGALVIAERQTKGRGRLNRKWVSPKGGIWLSVLLRPNFEISQASLFPILTSLALSIAIEKILKLKPKLKWPNDITLNSKKVAGILIDASIESNKIDYLVIGVGINFRIDPQVILKLIKNTRAQYGVTSLVKKNQRVDPTRLVQEFLFQLEQLQQKIVSNDLKGIRKEYLKRSSTIGKNVVVSTHKGKIIGKASSIDENGALIVSSKRKTQRVLVGDVIHT